MINKCILLPIMLKYVQVFSLLQFSTGKNGKKDFTTQEENKTLQNHLLISESGIASRKEDIKIHCMFCIYKIDHVNTNTATNFQSLENHR